jgi:hypothetical protein
MGSGWHHVAASWDLNVPVGQLYLDGVADTGGALTTTNDTWAYSTNQTDFLMPDSGLPTNNDMADIWFDPTRRFDLSVAGSLQKLRSAGGAPAIWAPVARYQPEVLHFVFLWSCSKLK